MKPIDLSLIPKIRRKASESGDSVFHFADIQRCCSHRNKSFVKRPVQIDGQTYVSYEDAVNLFSRSYKPNKEEALRLFRETHPKDTPDAPQPREPLKRHLVDLRDIYISKEEAETATVRKDSCELKIEEVWKSVEKACNDAKEFTEACYRRGIQYKSMYKEMKDKYDELLAKEKESGSADNSLWKRMLFLTVEYGKTREEKLWREKRRAAVADKDGLYEPTAIGKLIGMEARDVNRFLLENGIQRKTGGKGDKEPTYKVSDNLGGDFAVVGHYNEPNGRDFYQTRWTLKGLHYILGVWATDGLNGE